MQLSLFTLEGVIPDLVMADAMHAPYEVRKLCYNSGQEP